MSVVGQLTRAKLHGTHPCFGAAYAGILRQSPVHHTAAGARIKINVRISEADDKSMDEVMRGRLRLPSLMWDSPVESA
jgi:hypothetical protein